MVELALRTKLTRARRYWAVLDALEGAGWVLFALATAALLCFYLDRALVLSPEARLDRPGGGRAAGGRRGVAAHAGPPRGHLGLPRHAGPGRPGQAQAAARRQPGGDGHVGRPPGARVDALFPLR